MVFAIREAKKASLGFIPNDLVFGHSVRGPLKVLNEQLMSNRSVKSGVLDYASKFRGRLHQVRSMAKEALLHAQGRMKSHYDQKAVLREFKSGDKVLVLLPMPGSAFSARSYGPHVIESKINELDYVIKTPDRRPRY